MNVVICTSDEFVSERGPGTQVLPHILLCLQQCYTTRHQLSSRPSIANHYTPRGGSDEKIEGTYIL